MLKNTAQHQYRLRMLQTVFCARHKLRLKKQSNIECRLKLLHAAFCAKHDLRLKKEPRIETLRLQQTVLCKAKKS
jgi:hypothetical protein